MCKFYKFRDSFKGSTTLDENSSDTVEEAGLYHLATVDFCIMAPGGSCRYLEPLPGYIEVTTSPCDITYDDDTKIKRAKMPCGCVIGKQLDFWHIMIIA